MHSLTALAKKLYASKLAMGVLAVIVLGGGYLILHRKAPTYQFIPVTQGPITETVSVTGNTTPMKSVSLGFQNTGTIARIQYNLGDYVNAGSVIAELATGSLYAAFQEAKANLAVAQANLDSLTAGTRPEQLAIDENAVAQDQMALANSIASAYAAADNAVHTMADQFFTNPRTPNAALTVNPTDANLANTVLTERVALEPALDAWNATVNDPSFASSDPGSAATQAIANLNQVNAFLNDAATLLSKSQPTGTVTAANIATYQTNVNTARTSVTAALSALTTAKTALVGAQGTLALAKAGSTPQAIAAQQAQVEQAQAGVASALANLQNSEIIAPISGTITEQDAKVGQLASPGTPLVSIIGTGGFEVDAGVAETDVGKLAVGDKVTMTLDAFPNETFDGTLFYVAPAATNSQGVITYLIKISFDKADPRLKSGLTANITIETKHHDSALILPQYGILQNDNGTFVETLENGKVKTTPVTLGIQDQDGNVEVLSGVTLGEKVINIGLKAQ